MTSSWLLTWGIPIISLLRCISWVFYHSPIGRNGCHRQASFQAASVNGRLGLSVTCSNRCPFVTVSISFWTFAAMLGNKNIVCKNAITATVSCVIKVGLIWSKNSESALFRHHLYKKISDITSRGASLASKEDSKRISDFIRRSICFEKVCGKTVT